MRGVHAALRVMGCQSACKPGSVWRGPKPARDGHSSRAAVAGRLEQPTRATVMRQTWRVPWIISPWNATLSPLFGFAPGGACRAAPVARRAVRSYRTLSPLPARANPCRRFAFCGAFPRVAPAGRYPAPCLAGARTFLPSPNRSSSSGGRPADWQGGIGWGSHRVNR